MRGKFALDLVLGWRQPGENTVLDIGSGEGEQARVFAECGLRVTTIDAQWPATYNGFFPQAGPPVGATGRRFHIVWASHVLEHAPDVGHFLRAATWRLDDGAILAIVVPTNLNPSLLGGHLNLFTPASLLYNMVVAGIDCSRAAVRTDGWESAVVVRYRQITGVPPLAMDKGDLEILAPYFPMPVVQGMDGQLIGHDLNWEVLHGAHV